MEEQLPDRLCIQYMTFAQKYIFAGRAEDVVPNQIGIMWDSRALTGKSRIYQTIPGISLGPGERIAYFSQQGLFDKLTSQLTKTTLRRCDGCKHKLTCLVEKEREVTFESA